MHLGQNRSGVRDMTGDTTNSNEQRIKKSLGKAQVRTIMTGRKELQEKYLRDRTVGMGQ